MVRPTRISSSGPSGHRTHITSVDPQRHPGEIITPRTGGEPDRVCEAGAGKLPAWKRPDAHNAPRAREHHDLPVNWIGAVPIGYREEDKNSALLGMEQVPAGEPETVPCNLEHTDVVVQDIVRMPDEVVYLVDYRLTHEWCRINEKLRNFPLHEDQEAMHSTLAKASRTMDDGAERWSIATFREAR